MVLFVLAVNKGLCTTFRTIFERVDRHPHNTISNPKAASVSTERVQLFSDVLVRRAIEMRRVGFFVLQALLLVVKLEAAMFADV